MKDRIKVDGVWYVRDLTLDPLEMETDEMEQVNERDTVNFLGCIWETEEWSFEANITLKKFGEGIEDRSPDGFSVFCISKKDPDITHEILDSNWLIELVEGEVGGIQELDEDGNKKMRAFAYYLIKKGWLIKE
jgi:hypothetical protein